MPGGKIHPNLDTEYNPIVSIWGGSWPGLISVRIVFLIIIAFIGSYYFFKPSIVVKEKKLNFPDFIYCFFYDKLGIWQLYKAGLVLKQSTSGLFKVVVRLKGKNA